MASFYAYDFIFDGVPSQRFDLKIISFEDGSPVSGVGSPNVNIISQRVMRKSKPYYLGRTQEPVLEFPLTFGTTRVISGMERDIISQWLFGRSGYKKLYIMQDDLGGAYFNCFLTAPEPVYIGNLNFAFNTTVVCDSPFAYGPTRTIAKLPIDIPTIPYSFYIYNSSTEDEYLYPTIRMRVAMFFNTDISLTNLSDSSSRPFSWVFPAFSIGTSRLYSLPDQAPDEYDVIVDNDLQTINSQCSGIGISNFNKNWFRLVPKVNNIIIDSPINHIASRGTWITFTERLKIGG